jgi:hypothetical protein
MRLATASAVKECPHHILAKFTEATGNDYVHRHQPGSRVAFRSIVPNMLLERHLMFRSGHGARSTSFIGEPPIIRAYFIS